MIKPLKFNVPSKEDSNVGYVIDCNLDICICPQGVNGNACPHQAAFTLKFGINKANFISHTAKERFKLATPVVGSNKNFRVTQIEKNLDFSGDKNNGKPTVDNESRSTHQSDEMDILEEISQTTP